MERRKTAREHGKGLISKMELTGRHIWFRCLQRIWENASDENGKQEQNRGRDKLEVLR